MASDTQLRPRNTHRPTTWPPHDTEESILGTDLHQKTIINLRWGINEVAQLCRILDQPAPWQALSQIALLGCPRPDGSLIRTYPDVFVYRQSIDENRGSVAVYSDGPPVLIVEVLSDSTFEVDVDTELGKGYSYAQAGVQEYLALDPTGSMLREGGRAWRLADGVYQPWERDAQGRWQSAAIEVAIGLEGALATVYTRDGQRIHGEGQVEAELRRSREELAHQAAELERLRRLVDELQGKQ
jgi:hypothetical protein